MFGPFKVLALHGSSQTGEIFRTRLDPLISKCSPQQYRWVFPDGPVEHALLEGDTVPRQSWYDSRSSANVPTRAKFPVNPEDVKDAKVVVGFSQGAILAIACGFNHDSVRLVIASGPPDCSWIDAFLRKPSTRYLKVVLLAGETDEIVPPSSTKALYDKLIRCGIDVELRLFPGNHYFPVGPKQLDEYKRDLETWQLCAGTVESARVQDEESLVLQSIYADAIELEQGPPNVPNDLGLRVSLSLSEAPTEFKDARIILLCPSDYPFESNVNAWIDNARYDAKELDKVVQSCILNLKGEMQIFACISAVQEQIQLILSSNSKEAENELTVEASDEMDEAETLELISKVTSEARRVVLARAGEIDEDDTRQGHWNPCCIGLLGKPSAGKSSFFNACTQNLLQGKKEAEEGAQPFTTIDPNLGTANCRINSSLKVTLSVKDVAGLVPGAYKGLGKGNRFLNDLLDADALLHICDGTGSADDGGRVLFETSAAQSESQVVRDALWVLREVHLWIYGNVSAKWPHRKKGRSPGETNVLRGSVQSDKSYATRVCQLFAGYHAPPSITIRAAKYAGLDLESAPEFTKEMRHRLVAFFIVIRFPVVLVLNKCDQHIERNQGKVLKSTVQHSKEVMGREDLVVCASARLEKELLDMVQRGEIVYDPSEMKELKVLKNNDATKKILELLTGMEGSVTGVHQALVRAVKAAAPLAVEAIVDRERRSFLMYPGSTVYDLYETTIRTGMAMGDFVRAEEVIGDALGGRALSRDAPLRHHRTVRIATNKRIVHQQKSNS